MVKYPKWAPESVIAVHNAMRTNLAASELDTDDGLSKRADVVHTLLTSQEMQRAWKSLQRNWVPFLEEDTLDSALASFALHVAMGAAGGTSDWDLLPRAARIKNAQKIAKKTRELVRGITETLDCSVMGLINREEYIGGAFHTLSLHQPTPKTHEEVNTLSDEEWNGFRKTLSFDCAFRPHIRSILDEYAKWLDEKAKEPAMVPQPNASSANIVYFVRYIGADMPRLFGSPLHDAVATTASVVFGEDVDPERVRMILARSPNETM